LRRFPAGRTRLRGNIADIVKAATQAARPMLLFLAEQFQRSAL
jgi:hypothetical protein